MATIACTVLFMVFAFGLGAQGRNLFQKDEESGFIRLGERLDTDRRAKRDVDDRGSQNVYYVSRTPTVWGTAWLTCRQAMNGQLLTIETEAEDLFIRDLLIENNIASVFTSGAFDAGLGIWRWVATGGEISYTNWLKDQPASTDTSARVAIQNSLFSHGWNVVTDESIGHYICEVRAEPVEQPTHTPPPTTQPPTTQTANR